MIVSVNTLHKYNIHITQKPNFGELSKPFIAGRAILFFDKNLPQSIVNEVEESFAKSRISYQKIVFMQSGEDVKSFQCFEEVSKKLLEMGANRKDTFVAIGGGTVGDFVGFLAATFMRGVKFIQIPTTLLSMVDSSVGGKVAINLGNYKNCIGAFLQPQVVIIDTSFLKTLPKIEITSGYAEVLKYGFIRSKTFFEYLLEHEKKILNALQGNFSECEEYLEKIIGISCKIKGEFVVKDEKETLGIRDILNFGHTFGHAFETLYLGKIPHGIAVGIGMICACKASGVEVSEIVKHYQNVGLYSSIFDFSQEYDLNIPTIEEILQIMKKDKKNSNTQIKLILLEDIEVPKIQSFSEKEVLKILEEVIM